MHKLLMIDDDIALTDMLKEYLSEHSLDVSVENDPIAGIEVLRSHHYDVLLLDVMMPELDGFEVLRQIRQFSSIPVIMLTAKGDDFDRILGLELGADDYLPKPFNQRELVARIKALTRRYVDQSPQFTSASAPEKPHLLSLHNIVIDIQRLQASINQQNVEFTATELHMLHYLMLNAGKVITKDTLSQAILHRRLSAFDRSLDMHVSNIRKKLALHGVTDVIKTMRGVGYLCQIEEVQA